ncbi:MAG: TOBE domain-containing protein, partial [Pseudomonadota bacterium]
LFVAGFVGTPRINLVPVEVAEAGGRALARLPDGTTIATQVDFAALARGAGLTLGVRPEAIRLVEPAAAALRGTVRVVERLGDRTHVHVALSDGTLLTAEDRGDSRARPGEPAGLSVNGEEAHLFAADGTAYHGAAA